MEGSPHPSGHLPVLVAPLLAFFSGRPLSSVVDGTVGAGGHAYALLEQHPEIIHLYGFDRDPDALQRAGERLAPFGNKVTLIQEDFSRCAAHLSDPVQAMILDLGVSSMQLDTPERGFSVYKEGPLDMRMNPSARLSAAQVVNTYSERELARIFHEYGEEPRARAVAAALVTARKKKKLQTTRDLTLALERILTWGGRKGKKLHPMTLVFQALRIYVNDELGELERVLPIGLELLERGGRFGVITFHSLEDRIVKQAFRRFAVQEKRAILLTKKPVIATAEEIKANPRSRSAKLRVVEKI